MLREFTLEPRPLGRLDYALAELAKLDAEDAFGDRRCERKVTLHTGGRTLEHRLGAVGYESDRGERLFEAAWSLLAEGLDCSDCMRFESPDRKHFEPVKLTQRLFEQRLAFPAALVGRFQARGLIEPGARPLEVCVPPQRYLDELAQHGIVVEVRESN